MMLLSNFFHNASEVMT